VIADVVIPRTRAELEARLVGASPELAAILRAALEGGAAQFELGVD
jgi:hypothetical protein